jgi:hypothetical protein
MIARNRVWLAVAVAGLVVACNKGGGGGPSAGNVTSEASSALDFLPKDTSVAIGINPKKLKDSKYYSQLVNNMPAEAKDALTQAKTSCGLDWQNDFDSIVVGTGGNMDKERAVILVKGDWDHDKLAKCATVFAEKKGKKLTVTKEGELTVVQAEGEKPVYLAWPAKGTLMLTGTSAKGDKVLLTDLMKKASSVKENKDFVALLNSTDTSSSVWGAYQVPAADAQTAMQNLNPGGTQKLLGVYGSLQLAKDLKATIGLRVDSDPKPVADKLNAKLDEGRKQAPPQFADLMKGVTISSAANDVLVKISLTEQQLDQIVQMVGQYLPMMMGGMGGAGGDEPPK